MAAPATDCGLSVVENYFSLLKIDEKSCLREERGFTWWAEDLAQRIWSDPAVVHDGTTSWKIHARTDFLRGFVDRESNLGYLNQLATFASLGGGLIRDPLQRDRIQLASCLNATEAAFEWAKSFFPSTAATQTAEAHLLAHMVPAMTECSAAYSAHPVAGPARRHRVVLDLLGSYVSAGKNPPVWTAEDFAEAADELEEEPYSVSASESGLTAQFRFRDLTATGEMTIEAEHPSYGHGLQVRLVLPMTLSDDEDPEIVLRCNRFEIDSMAGVGHFTGSYDADDEGFRYSNFIPNLPSYRRVPFLTSLIRFLALRARWLETAVGGDGWAEIEPPAKPRTWTN
jgi:hypothetical protein